MNFRTVTCFVIGLILADCLVRLLPEVHAQGSVVVSTQGDLTMNGSSAIAIGTGSSRWIDVFPLTGNSAVVRCGDSTVSASRGGPLAAGGAYRFTAAGNQNLVFDRSTLYCYGSNGDKIAFLFGAN